MKRDEMTSPLPRPRGTSQGFTLIEVIIVIVLFSIVAAGALAVFNSISSSPELSLTILGAELAQTNMEEVIADKKSASLGFSTITSAPITVPSPFTSGTLEVFCVDEGDLDANNGDAAAACDGGADIEAKRVLV